MKIGGPGTESVVGTREDRRVGRGMSWDTGWSTCPGEEDVWGCFGALEDADQNCEGTVEISDDFDRTSQTVASCFDLCPELR